MIFLLWEGGVVVPLKSMTTDHPARVKHGVRNINLDDDLTHSRSSSVRRWYSEVDVLKKLDRKL